MHIGIVSPSYPVAKSTNYAFVEQLVNEFVRQGNRCTVITPYNTYWKNGEQTPLEFEIKRVGINGFVEVFRPRFRNRNIPFFPISSTYHCAQLAFEEVIKKRKLQFDCIYCHFFVSANIAWHYAHKNSIPLYIATGESVIPRKIQKASFQFTWKKFRKDTHGVICVSSKNLDECVKLNYADKSKCKVFPNGIDETLFKKINKKECRKKLSISEDKFVVAFVGWYSNRKGVMRLSEAIDGIKENDVFSFFIGGKQNVYDIEPSCKNIIFKGTLPHDDIPLYLNAADVFVLPTLHEGCCNAVIEAMACGLPIISSNRSFNRDVLNDTNAILVDPNNIDEIKSAIIKIRDSKQLQIQLSHGALEMAENLSLSMRAKNILSFIKETLQ